MYIGASVQKCIARLFLLTLIVSSSCSPKIASDPNLESKIFCYLESEKQEYSKEEYIYLFFIVENRSTQEVFIDNNPYGFYIDGQKIGGFEISVLDQQDRKIAPNHDGISLGSGRYGITKIGLGERCKINIALSRDYKLTNEGQYTILARREMNILMNPKKRIGKTTEDNYEYAMPCIKEASISITIKAS